MVPSVRGSRIGGAPGRRADVEDGAYGAAEVLPRAGIRQPVTTQQHGGGQVDQAQGHDVDGVAVTALPQLTRQPHQQLHRHRVGGRQVGGDTLGYIAQQLLAPHGEQ